MIIRVGFLHFFSLLFPFRSSIRWFNTLSLSFGRVHRNIYRWWWWWRASVCVCVFVWKRLTDRSAGVDAGATWTDLDIYHEMEKDRSEHVMHFIYKYIYRAHGTRFRCGKWQGELWASRPDLCEASDSFYRAYECGEDTLPWNVDFDFHLRRGNDQNFVNRYRRCMR